MPVLQSVSTLWKIQVLFWDHQRNYDWKWQIHTDTRNRQPKHWWRSRWSPETVHIFCGFQDDCQKPTSLFSPDWLPSLLPSGAAWPKWHGKYRCGPSLSQRFSSVPAAHCTIFKNQSGNILRITYHYLPTIFKMARWQVVELFENVQWAYQESIFPAISQ